MFSAEDALLPAVQLVGNGVLRLQGGNWASAAWFPRVCASLLKGPGQRGCLKGMQCAVKMGEVGELPELDQGDGTQTEEESQTDVSCSSFRFT